MDKSWIYEKDRFSAIYKEGVDSFLNFARINNKRFDSLIRCPCCICLTTKYKTIEEVGKDLHLNGFSKSYTEWIWHGEGVNRNDDMNEMNDEFVESDDDGLCEMLCEMAEQAPGCFSEFFKHAKTELYLGCKESLLSTVIKLMHIKVRNKWSNKSFDMLLEFLKYILPEGNTLPSSFYGAKRILDEIGTGYEEIEVCKNDCVLYYKENENKTHCPICDEPRWKLGDESPRKVLRYFPIKPQLQRLFMFSKTAKKMRWHKDQRKVEEGVMRHPADSRAWKHVDAKFPEFAQDARNIRLGLAADGFTPWSNLENSYSMWPVILTVYNLPGFMFMKEEFLMMSLLIPGPRSPGQDIDVFLRPLIDDLKELWEIGLNTYDAFSKESFQMRAMVMWTISDFPGYAVLSGWVTAGKFTCPCCFDETPSESLRFKTGFIGHRRFLAKDHRWRKNKRSFNGKEGHDLKSYVVLMF